jgi:hypothetical protein
LTNYRPIPQCSCDNPKILADHSHQDYVFQFLMGLNDSFAQIRGQILLIDPLPSINKVFSLVIQEERQREISVHPVQVETAALMTRASSQYQNQQHHNGKSVRTSLCVLIVVCSATQWKNVINCMGTPQGTSSTRTSRIPFQQIKSKKLINLFRFLSFLFLNSRFNNCFLSLNLQLQFLRILLQHFK